MASTDLETGPSLIAWQTFLALGPGRSLPQLVTALGRRPSYLRQVKSWSARFGWQARAAAHDHMELQEALGARREVRERAMQGLVDAAGAATRLVVDVLEDTRTLPILDRHGRRVGERPLVSASTKLQAAMWIHSVTGITPVKRMQLQLGEEPSMSREADKVLDLATLAECDALHAMFLEIESRGNTPATETPATEEAAADAPPQRD